LTPDNTNDCFFISGTFGFFFSQAVELRVHSDVDSFLSQLCVELDAGPVEAYRLCLRVRIGLTYARDERQRLEVSVTK
jgi:hypothetical protein